MWGEGHVGGVVCRGLLLEQQGVLKYPSVDTGNKWGSYKEQQAGLTTETSL